MLLHARSLFSQGLLLLPHETIPAKFNKWGCLWDMWNDWLAMNNIFAPQACISFVQTFSQIDRLVVETESAKQFSQIIDAAKNKPNTTLPDMRCNDEMLINPSNWNLL